MKVLLLLNLLIIKSLLYVVSGYEISILNLLVLGKVCPQKVLNSHHLGSKCSSFSKKDPPDPTVVQGPLPRFALELLLVVMSSVDCLLMLTDPSIESQVLDSDSESDSELGSVPEGLSATMKLDDWLVFRLDNEAASLVYQLRLKWHTLLLRRLKNANKPWTPVSEHFIYLWLKHYYGQVIFKKNTKPVIVIYFQALSTVMLLPSGKGKLN